MNKLEPLDNSHNRKSFDCGVAPLNIYLQQTARQHAERDISRVFVLVSKEGLEPKPVLGYFSLAACEAKKGDLPEALARKLPNDLPAARLGCDALSLCRDTLSLGCDTLSLFRDEGRQGGTLRFRESFEEDIEGRIFQS